MTWSLTTVFLSEQLRIFTQAAVIRFVLFKILKVKIIMKK